MPHIFNLRKDPTDRRDHVAMRSLAHLPVSVTHLADLGPVRDQGNSGSCTGQAMAGFMDWLAKRFQRYLPQTPPSQFSALFVYAEERIGDGSFPADAGSDSRSGMKVLNQMGICADSLMPFSDTAIRQRPSAVGLTQAAPFRIGAYHRVWLDAGLATSRSVLASGYCHCIGIPVYPAIESDEVAATGILPIPKQLATPSGAHEMLVYGYDDAQALEKVRNSWGAAWGIAGDLRIPYEYFAAVGGDQTSDAWVGHLGKPW